MLENIKIGSNRLWPCLNYHINKYFFKHELRFPLIFFYWWSFQTRCINSKINFSGVISLKSTSISLTDNKMNIPNRACALSHWVRRVSGSRRRNRPKQCRCVALCTYTYPYFLYTAYSKCQCSGSSVRYLRSSLCILKFFGPESKMT